MATRSWLWILVLPVVLLGAAGCQSTSGQLQSGGRSLAADDTDGPSPGHPRESGTGMLLRTGAIQLGPDVCRNQWGWQGDGKGGF
jgi:hypothetical protein